MEDELFEVIEGPGCWHAFKAGDIIYPLHQLPKGWRNARFTLKSGKYAGSQILHSTQVRKLCISLENK